MNKKYLSVVLFSALTLGTAGTFTSCKDYDDDIENLQGQITTLKGTVDDLQKKIESGLVVTKVEKSANGVNITFSNGQTYELKDGADGKDAVVWTIGQDGFWYQDGEKTEYKAIGADGAAGANGYYYKPNAKTGCFDIYVIDAEGKEKFVEATTISYVSAVEGVSVVHDGNKLIIKGAVDSKGNPADVELNLGKELASVAFVPDFLDEYSKYPLAKFYHVDGFLDETKYVTTAGATQYNFIGQTKLDKSNEVKLTYRVNPQGAYVEGAVLNFINRSIQQTKAIAGDKTDLLNVVSTTISDEQIVVKAGINASKRVAAGESTATAKFDLAALQTSVGTGVPVTSDYIAVRSEAVVPSLVDSVLTTAAAPVSYYDRSKAITSTNVENDAFVKLFVPAVADVAGTKAIPAHLKFAYKDANGNAGKIDLRKKVGLFVAADGKYLASNPYEISGMSYEFSLPAEYKDVDANKTNQQWFVKLNGSELSINTDNLTGGLTQAIGRRPVVRVDAFLTNNAGAKKLVASAYIRLEIVERDPVSVSAHNIELGAAKSYEYHALTATDTEVANMAWSRINNEIYGVESLTATNFWNFYGGAADTYEVKVITYHKVTGNETVLLDDNAVPSNMVYNNTSIPGLSLQIDLNAAAGTTSVVKVGTNNKVKTENTYKDMGNGAQYKVTITIKSDDTTQHGNFILTQVINVKDDCKYYEFNPNYYFNSWNSVAGDYIVVKGKVAGTPASWQLTSQLSEHFKLIGSQDIFAYYGTATDPVKNVQAGSIVFKWTETDVLPAGNITADATLQLHHAMSASEEIKNMNYEFTLVNGEKCKTAYKVVFVNPFVAGSPAAVSLNGNAVGAQNVATAPSVIVKDKAGDDIYKWNATTSALALTTKATNDYKVAAPTVSYAWVRDANYNSFVSQLTSPATQLQLAADGKVTWDNEGATLANSHDLKVEATVTFANLSIVKVVIPVTIKAN